MQIDCTKAIYYILFFSHTCYGFMIWFLISKQILQVSGKSK